MLMTIQFPIHPFWNFYCQNLGGKVSTNMQLNAPFLKMNFFLPKIVIIFKSKSSLKCESTMKWSVKSIPYGMPGCSSSRNKRAVRDVKEFSRCCVPAREGGAFSDARIPAIKSTRNLSCWNKPWARYSISLHNERNLIAGLTITRKTTPMLSKWQALRNVSIMEPSFDVILWSYWGCQRTPHPAVWPGKHLLQLRCR